MTGQWVEVYKFCCISSILVPSVYVYLENPCLSMKMCSDYYA